MDEEKFVKNLESSKGKEIKKEYMKITKETHVTVENAYSYDAYSSDSSCDFDLVYVFKNGKLIGVNIDLNDSF